MPTVKYTKEHEWISVDGDIGTVGISVYAQEQLGDVVFVELPELGKRYDKGVEAAVVESVKAASEVFAPVAGEIVEVNSALEDEPATVNSDARGNGWFFKIKISNAADLEELLEEAAYEAYVEALD